MDISEVKMAIPKRFIRSEEADGIKFFYETLTIQTERENLTQLDTKLLPYVQPNDYFFVEDITDRLKSIVAVSGVQDGSLLVQVLHTSAMLSMNELDEPMLLGDINRRVNDIVPKSSNYLHNSPLRSKNLCEDDYKCDRNGDAHVKSCLFGTPSITIIVRGGELVLGQWQKVCLIDFDGPRTRSVVAQVMGV